MKLSELSLPPAAQKGVWFDYVDAWTMEPSPGFRVMLASTRLEDYRRDAARPMQEYAQRVMQSGGRSNQRLPEAAAEQAQIQALAKYVLLNWDGLTDDNGVALLCNQENKLKFLAEPRARDSIVRLADDLSAFVGAELGNSPPSQGSTSS